MNSSTFELDKCNISLRSLSIGRVATYISKGLDLPDWSTKVLTTKGGRSYFEKVNLPCGHFHFNPGSTLSILAFIGQISGSTRTSLNRARTIDIYAGL